MKSDGMSLGVRSRSLPWDAGKGCDGEAGAPSCRKIDVVSISPSEFSLPQFLKCKNNIDSSRNAIWEPLHPHSLGIPGEPSITATGANTTLLVSTRFPLRAKHINANSGV